MAETTVNQNAEIPIDYQNVFAEKTGELKNRFENKRGNNIAESSKGNKLRRSLSREFGARREYLVKISARKCV